MITKLVFDDDSNPGERISVSRRGDEIILKISNTNTVCRVPVAEWLFIAQEMIGDGT